MPYKEYMSEFRRLSQHVRGLPEEYLISCFTSGLKEPNRFEIMTKEPTTSKTAMRMVLMKEEKNISLKGSKRNKF